jgi:hypothetical protein
VKKNGSFHTGETVVNKSVEWLTPLFIFEALGLTFDLDPCAGESGDQVPARVRYTARDDGLSKDWSGTVWLNPPYGPHTPRWLRRLVKHGDGIALVFARTDTAWFHRAAPRADLLCFTRRIAFEPGPERLGQQPTIFPGAAPLPRGYAAAGAGSVLLAYGERCADALMRSGLGLCVTPLRP